MHTFNNLLNEFFTKMGIISISLYASYIFVSMFSSVRCETIHDLADINKMFPSFQDKPVDLDIPDLYSKNITVDLEKLDLSKFKQKLETDLKGKLEEEDNATKSARRQVLHYTYNRGRDSYIKASLHMTKVKGLDLMLQLIYMAKHRVMRLETDVYFSKTDTGYRIGFIYRKMTYLLRKLKDLYSYMREHYREGTPTKHIMLHQKAVKIHTDYIFLYWITVRLHGRLAERSGNPAVLPKSLQATGGLTDDDELYQRPPRPPQPPNNDK